MYQSVLCLNRLYHLRDNIFSMDFFKNIKAKLRRMLFLDKGKEFTNEPDRINISSLRTVTRLGFLFEMSGLIMLLPGGLTAGNYFLSVIQLSFCAVVCFAAYIITSISKKHTSHNHSFVTLGSLLLLRYPRYFAENLPMPRFTATAVMSF